MIALLVQKLTESRFVIRTSKSGNRNLESYVCGDQLYPNGYMVVGYLLFLQEQIKGIIINEPRPVWTSLPITH